MILFPASLVVSWRGMIGSSLLVSKQDVKHQGDASP